MHAVEQRQLVEDARRVGEQKIRDDRHQRRLPQVALDGGDDVDSAVARCRRQIGAAGLLVQVEAVDDVRLADARPRRRDLPKGLVERDQAELILKEHRRQAHGRHRARDGGGDRHAGGAAPRGQRRVGDGHHRRGAVLLELAHDHRAEVGQRRLRPVDRRQAVARLPVAQADEVEPGALEHARVIAERELLHAPEDEELDLGDFGQVDEGRRLDSPSWNGHPVDDVVDDHLDGTPWLAACGPSQTRWPSTYLARSWMSSG